MIPLGVFFWLLWLFTLIFSGWRNRAVIADWAGESLIVWVLIGILGLKTFGFPFGG